MKITVNNNERNAMKTMEECVAELKSETLDGLRALKKTCLHEIEYLYREVDGAKAMYNEVSYPTSGVEDRRIAHLETYNEHINAEIERRS